MNSVLLKLKGYTSEPLNRRAAMRRLERIALALFRLGLFIGLSYVILYPILYMLSTAFRSDADILDTSIVWIPKHFVLNNIKQAFVSLNYPRSLWYTVFYNIVSAVLQIAVTAFVGYGFARFKFKGRGVLFAIALFTIIVPAQTTIIPMFVSFSNFDVLGIMKLVRLISGTDINISILNTPFAFWLPAIFGMGIRSGLFIYIFRQFFRNMPKELEEAAWIDGAGLFRTFFSISIPSSSVVFTTVSIFAMVWHWNEYFEPIMFMSKNFPLSVKIYELENLIEAIGVYDTYPQYSTKKAACFIFILPVLAVYLILQKKFVKSIDRVGITG